MILEGKTALVTGGTGSLGKVLVRRLLSGELGTPAKVIVFSRDEAKQHEMRLSYLRRRVSTDEVIYDNFSHVLEFRIGDVRSYADVCRSVKGADYVFNAAALKQVPTCEYFPDQAILTNCMGALNISRAIHENDYPVEAVVGISTDKACKPVNVMGMTKALQERIFIASNLHSPGTRFVAVRYGNVLASRGSVIPLFREQIRLGGPVTITVPEMTRFLLSLDDAVGLVFAALREARAGETYIPICPSANLLTLAQALIGDREIDCVVSGARPGEKMHEVLISEEEIRHVRRRGEFFAIVPMLPELSPEKGSPGELAREYSSAHSVLGLEETAKLLTHHGMMVEDPTSVPTEELLR
ncbi:MAG: polysaccharide biosynthesis protein [Actinomycetota bacterium]